MLDDIIAGVREDLAAREQQVPLDELKRRVETVPDPIDALAVLRQGGVGVIAEVKRASPSRGQMAEIARILGKGEAVERRYASLADNARLAWQAECMNPDGTLLVDKDERPFVDGDCTPEERIWVRGHADILLTNPEMLHHGILPNHGRWATFLHRLELVVIDELHVLRGVFGTHTAQVLRRLRRLAQSYGAAPRFVFTSATIGDPARLASMGAAAAARRARSTPQCRAAPAAPPGGPAWWR